ncbi:RNase H domain-containing protein [Trichonephila clavipes]|nr:RNase H domain-containing protein [Trichonephila clavipes]
MKRVIQYRIDNAWQESWNLQTNNKLYCVKPVIGALPVIPMRRIDVKLIRLRIGHTRFTHRHLLLEVNQCFSSIIGYIVRASNKGAREKKKVGSFHIFSKMYKNALKEDLIRVVEDLDGTVESTDTIAKLKTKIEKSSTFESDADFVKTLIKNCIDERVSRNEREATLEKQKIELAKLQLAQLEKEVELQTAKNEALSLNLSCS